MKVVKTSAIALTLSAMLAGPVLAQGAASDTQTRGTMQGRNMQQGGAAGGADTELNAQAPGAKAGAGTATKGTVGSGTARGAAGATGGVDAAGDPAAGTKRH
ncbi:type IV secretory pathway TrbL component [Nitrobacteraceae bacterium AZCC 2161]|jgi:hypothetical protein